MNCSPNIITANFSGGKTSATTAPLWQWDYGQVLCITGIEDLPATFEVHFSTNKTGGVSTVAVGADGQVTIPNVLLTIGKNLNAWIYLSDSEGEGETEYSILIPVKARPMPETYDAEATGVFDDVVRQVSEYAETAQTAADNAGASASAATASAENAAASASAAETAKTAAETAQGKAEDAQAAAETAAQTATQKSEQTAQDAAQAASDAGRAESAAQSAEAAQMGAENAKTDTETAAQGAAASASAASENATSAVQAATSAAQSATAAAGSATTAQGAAQTATTKAGEASASATAAAASATAAQTARTAAEAAETNAGQSASTATAKAAEAVQSASGAAQSKTDAEAAAARAEQAAATLMVDTALSDTSTNPVQNKVITGELTDVKSAIDELDDLLPTASASGAVIHFNDENGGNAFKSFTAEIVPAQDGSGTPSSGNVRPITGYTGLDINQSQKNLLPMTVYNGGTYNPTVGSTLSLSVAGAAKQLTPNAAKTEWTVSTTTSQTMFTLLCPVKYGIGYTIDFTISATKLSVSKAWLDKNFKVLSRTNSTSNSQHLTGSLSVPANAAYYAIIFTNSSTASQTITVTNPMIRLSTDTSDYEPYNGEIKTLSWQTEAGTVYGGSVNPITGKLVSTLGYIASYDGETIGEPWISSIDEYAPNTSPSTGAQVVYPLATPVEYNLTPIDIETLQGLNIISVNTGDTSMSYLTGTGGLNDVIGLTATMLSEVNDIIVGKISNYGLSSDALLYVDKIPAYYIDPEDTPESFDEAQAYLDNKIEAIPTGGKSFIYITDTHWAGNEKHSTFLINYIRKRTGIQKVVFGGDCFGNADDKYLAMRLAGLYLNQSKRAFGFDYLPCVGDHDNNTVNVSGEPEDTFLPYVQIQKLFMDSLERCPDCHVYDPAEKLANFATVGTDDYNGALAFFHTVYYVDDEKQRIRFIALNTGNGGNYGSMYNVFGSSGSPLLRLQLDFVADTLMHTPAGWDIVVYSHKGTIEESGSAGTTLAKILHGFKTKASACKPYPASSTDAINSWWPHTTEYDFSTRPEIGLIITLDGHDHSDHLYWFGTSSGAWAFEQSMSSGGTIVQPDEITAETTTVQIPAIVTATDSLGGQPVSNPMTADTVTEQCFDVITILDDEIVMTRIGAGNDRSITISRE